MLPAGLPGDAGGVIDFHQELIDDSPAEVMKSVERIGVIAADLLAQAKSTGKTPLEVADAMVRQRLAAAQKS